MQVLEGLLCTYSIRIRISLSFNLAFLSIESILLSYGSFYLPQEQENVWCNITSTLLPLASSQKTGRFCLCKLTRGPVDFHLGTRHTAIERQTPTGKDKVSMGLRFRVCFVRILHADVPLRKDTGSLHSVTLPHVANIMPNIYQSAVFWEGSSSEESIYCQEKCAAAADE